MVKIKEILLLIPVINIFCLYFFVKNDLLPSKLKNILSDKNKFRSYIILNSIILMCLAFYITFFWLRSIIPPENWGF